MRKFRVVVDGSKYEVEIEEIGCGCAAPQYVAPVVPVAAPAPVAPAAPVEAPKAEAPAAPVAVPAGGIEVKAPMPGTIVKIVAQTGTAVKKGQPIVVLEAMKMENDIAAPADGTVTIITNSGANVESGTVLAVIK